MLSKVLSWLAGALMSSALLNPSLVWLFNRTVPLPYSATEIDQHRRTGREPGLLVVVVVTTS